MLWETPSIFFGGVAAESIVWVTLDDGDSWRLLKLIRVGARFDADIDADAEIVPPFSQPFCSQPFGY
jgi:hypothetical protein